VFKKNLPIILVLLAGGLFILLLKYSSGDVGGLSETKTGDSTIDEGFRSEITHFRAGLWDKTIYLDLESRVGSAEMAHELSKTQYDALCLELALAKRDALIRSFDETRKSNCSDIPSLKSIVTEMQAHKVAYGAEQLQERITMFSHLTNFMSLEGAVNNCLAKMYTAVLVSGILNRISSASSLSGVSDCSECQSMKKKWKSQVEKLEGIDKSFNFYIHQRSMSYNACETFKPYAYYYKQLVDEGLCFN
jgi:hypothetical protein